MTPQESTDDVTPHENAANHQWDLRELPAETASWASCVFHALDVARERLTIARAPVWMHQTINGMADEFGQALERVRPLP